MNKKEYKSVYNYLKKISEYDADILSSVRYKQLLSEFNLETPQNLREDSLKMQLVEESFENISGTLLDFKSLPIETQQEEVIWQREEFVRQMIRRRISFYSEEEKRALLLQMIQDLREYQEIPMEEKEVLQLRQKSLETLEELLVEEIIEVSSELVGTIDVNDWEIDAIHSENEKIESDFSAGASAGAVYMLEEQMRAYPEGIGIVTGATASTFQAINKNNIKFIGNLLFLIASAMVTTVFFSYASGMGVSSTNLIFKNIFQKEKWIAFFRDSIQVFHTEIQTFKLSNWIYKGISFVTNLWNNDVELLENTNSSVVESLLDEEIEEEEEEEA